ncbi:discoidin domain-containing protein, partial [Cetobacterium sp.]|uniref:discoidin domain-containing protein n=1 Tax=Cetobacterium sp. TaxID=2071632 RepID=UPI003F383014
MQNNLIFTIETNIKNVINKLEIITNENILNAEIRYSDEHGYEKVANLLNVQKLEDKTLLTFDYFYSDKFDFVVDGNISENSIQDIKIITLNQNEFYESQDVDTKMTKEGLIATTLCGQYSSKSPNYMLDGQNNTNFHSADYRNYAPGTYGDVVIQLDKIQLVDKLSMITNSSGNGRIKSYEILYRTTQTENWKKVFEQVTEQSGTGREARFKPVLAKEFCIRVTNGQNHFIVIYEVDLFKHNFIDTRISNLFSDSAETVIKQSVTLEEIEDLEAEVTTESYIERLKNAKELYILGLPQNCFEIPLDEEKIFDKIQFITTERVLKVNLKYLDSYGIERVVETDFEVLGNVYTINTNKIMTSNASLVMFGFSEIENINTNNYDKSEFYIDEDITTEISKDKILASTTCPNGTSYPLSNMFDGNLSSSFHSNNYVEYCDVYFKLDKEYLIDKLSLISYRSNTSGLIKKFKVLVKEMNTNEWVELGEHTITLHENKWLDVKNKNSYLTNEVCLRIEDSVNKWSIVNELKIFIHSNLEKEINNLYSDENYEKLREGVSYEEILNLEAKNLVTLEFVEKIEKAKELYISNLNQNYFSLSLKEEKIFDKVQFSTPERVLRAYIKYVDSYGIERLIKSNFENLGDIYTLNIKKILTSNASLIVFGVSKIENILTNEYPKSEFYLNEDVDTRITSDKITATSANSHSSYPVTNIFDKNINSEHRTSYYTDYYDIYLKLDKEYLIDRLRLISFRGNVSGLINSFKVLLKDMNTENDWIELGENTRSTYTNSWNKVSGKPYLTDEVCIRVTDSVEKWIILNEVELFIHNNLEKD